jgi:hypothetical protein
MHTYKIRITGGERANLVEAVNSRQVVVLAEENSDTCYFIIPADDSEKFLRAASAFNSPAEKISISELREKYSINSYHTLSGDCKLVAALFQ